jgi:hypothetical protein
MGERWRQKRYACSLACCSRMCGVILSHTSTSASTSTRTSTTTSTSTGTSSVNIISNIRLRVDKGGMRFMERFVCVLLGVLVHHRSDVAAGVDEGGIRLRVDQGGIMFRVFLCVFSYVFYYFTVIL